MLPGVVSATLTDRPPLSGQFSSTGVALKDRPTPSTDHIIGVHWVSPAYLTTMKIPLIRGRWFSSADREDSAKVLVVNETAARRYWPGEDPIGKRIGIGISREFYSDGAEVIGVIADVRYGKPDELPTPDAYVSASQVILSSSEFRAAQFEGYYNVLLHRTSSPSDQAFMTNLIGSSIDIRSARLFWETSPEFFARG